MDCLLQTQSCKKEICSLKCCESLVCVDANAHMYPRLLKAFEEQSNYYRGLIALQCPLSSCKTRAQFFSEQSVDSPIYDSRCDQLHLTTILTESCVKVIQEYCASNMGQPNFVDESVCTSFVTSHSLFTTHDWISECALAYNETKNNEYPVMSITCYSVVLQQCVSNNDCPCFEKQYINSTHLQLIECPFNTCSPILTIQNLNTTVFCLLLLVYIMFEFYKQQNDKRKKLNT